MRLSFLLLFVFTSIIAQGQPNIQWQKCFGGSGYEFPGGIALKANGSFMIAGGSSSSNGQVTGHHPGTCGSGYECSDFWIVNADSLGNIIWAKSYGGINEDIAYSIALTSTGGGVICGLSLSNDGDVSGNHGIDDSWVISVDSLGNLLWQKSFGGSNGENSKSIIETNDNSYVVAGYSWSVDGDVPGNHRPNPPPGGETSDVWIINIDSSGAILWSKNFGGPGDDLANSIIQTNDGGFAFIGITNSAGGDVPAVHGGRDILLGRLDALGNILWAKSYGGSGTDEGNSIKQTPDSGFVLVGRTASNDGDISFSHNPPSFDVWVIKTDKFGTIEWEKAIGGSQSDIGAGILEQDSGYIVLGSASSNDGDVIGNHGGIGILDSYLFMLDLNGQLIWSKCLGSFGSEWSTALGEGRVDEYFVLSMTDSNNGDVSGNHGGNDYWLAKLSSTPVSISEISNDGDYNLFPNPFKDIINLSQEFPETGEIKIFNTLGKLVYSSQLKSRTAIDLSFLDDGIYFLKYKDEKVTHIKKIIKQN